MHKRVSNEKDFEEEVNLKIMLMRIKKCLQKVRQDYIGEYAAECAYFTILSFIPFILFLITLIQFTSIDKQTIFDIIRRFLPVNTQQIIFQILEEVYSKSIKTISISVLVALWSASKGFYSLCKGFKTIYKVEEKMNIINRIEGILYTICFMIAIILVLLFIVFGNRIHHLIIYYFPTWGFITVSILKMRTVIVAGMLCIIFLLIYKFIPKHHMKLVNQIPGAIFSSIGCIVTSFVFSIYVNLFKGFTNMYGSLTTIILIMMWTYVCMFIILLGAEINMALKSFSIGQLSKKIIRKIKNMR